MSLKGLRPLTDNKQQRVNREGTGKWTVYKAECVPSTVNHLKSHLFLQSTILKACK